MSIYFSTLAIKKIVFKLILFLNLGLKENFT